MPFCIQNNQMPSLSSPQFEAQGEHTGHIPNSHCVGKVLRSPSLVVYTRRLG